jgi:hypothetical protein
MFTASHTVCRSVLNKIKDDYNQFTFNGIFDMFTQQERVFNIVAKDVVDLCFKGYN